MLPGPFGHFGEVRNAAGGDNLHLSERSRAEKMRCLQVLEKDARVLRPLSHIGSDVLLQTGRQQRSRRHSDGPPPQFHVCIRHNATSCTRDRQPCCHGNQPERRSKRFTLFQLERRLGENEQVQFSKG